MNAPTVKLETISPQTASRYMDMNLESNRAISMRHVHKLAADIAHDRFKLTGDTVKFTVDEKGSPRMMDGQHRMMAIIEAGKSIQCYVCRNLPWDVFDVIDAGRARSAGDILHSAGWVNGFNVAAAVRAVYLIERKKFDTKAPLSNATILETALRHQKGLVPLVSQLCGERHFRAGRVIAALYWVQRIDRERGLEFQELLVDGLIADRDNPIYPLRQKLITDKGFAARKRGTMAPFFAMTFRAWSAFLSGEPLKMAKSQYQLGDAFPWPDAPNGLYLQDNGD